MHQKTGGIAAVENKGIGEVNMRSMKNEFVAWTAAAVIALQAAIDCKFFGVPEGLIVPIMMAVYLLAGIPFNSLMDKRAKARRRPRRKQPKFYTLAKTDWPMKEVN